MDIRQKLRAFFNTKPWRREQASAWASLHYPPEKVETAARVMVCVLDTLGCGVEGLAPSSLFHEEINLVSLMDVELALAAEEEFGIKRIPDEDLGNIATLGDLIEYVWTRAPK